MELEIAKVEIMKLMEKDRHGMHGCKNEWAQLLNDAPEAFIEKDIYLKGFQQYGPNWCRIAPKPSREVLLEAAIQDMRYFQSDLLREKEFVMEVYATANSRGKNLGNSSLDEISTELKKDKDIVLLAVKNNGSNYKHSSKARSIREDEEIIKTAIAGDWSMYHQIPEKFQERKDIVLLTVGREPCMLGHIQLYRDDRDVLMTAVQKAGRTLRFASERLKNDRELCLTAVLNDSNALEFVPEKFIEDIEFSIQANQSQNKGDFLQFCGSLRYDSAFAEMAIESNYRNYEYASYKDRLREDIYKPMLDVSQGLGYELLPDVLREDVTVFATCLAKAKCTDDAIGSQQGEINGQTLSRILQAAPVSIQRILIDEGEFRGASKIPAEVLFQECRESHNAHWSYSPWQEQRFTKNLEAASKRLDSYLLNQKLQSALNSEPRSQLLSVEQNRAQSRPTARMKI